MALETIFPTGKYGINEDTFSVRVGMYATVVATRSSEGVWTLTAAGTALQAAGSAGSFIFNETPSGLRNASNKIYTLIRTPLPGASLMLYYNNMLMTAGVEFTLSAGTITFATLTPDSSLAVPDVLLASYQY